MKFKEIPDNYFITILDRLTRFEPAHKRYDRVFCDIINKFCIDIKSNNLNIEEKISIVEKILNFSIDNEKSFNINNILMELEEKYFKYEPISYQYLSARLDFCSMLKKIEKIEKMPKNVIWLKEILNNQSNITKLRKEKKLLFPIEKIILCEGQTEYTLLETIFKLFDIDLNKLGYMTLPAGGKNQVARKYYEMIEYIKLPFFILLDKDAFGTKEIIEPKLRPQDKLYLIDSGEFEDLIPKKILQNAINTVHSSDFNCIFDDFNDEESMVKNLENIYKKYGFGEFKKAKFANELKSYIEQHATKDDFKNSEIIDIIKSLN